MARSARGVPIEPDGPTRDDVAGACIPSSEDAGITQLLVGDVDRRLGVEIVVVDEATARRSSARVKVLRLRAERVASGGSLPCVADTRVAAGALALAIGDVSGEAGERNDIVVGDACVVWSAACVRDVRGGGPLCDLPGAPRASPVGWLSVTSCRTTRVTRS